MQSIPLKTEDVKKFVQDFTKETQHVQKKISPPPGQTENQNNNPPRGTNGERPSRLRSNSQETSQKIIHPENDLPPAQPPDSNSLQSFAAEEKGEHDVV